MKSLINFALSLILYSSISAQCPAGIITLNSQSDIDNFAITYPSCTAPNGLTINGGHDFSPLSIINHINGDPVSYTHLTLPTTSRV